MPVRPLSPRLTRGLFVAGLVLPAGLSLGCRSEAYRRLADAGSDLRDRAVDVGSLTPEGPAVDPFAEAAAAAGDRAWGASAVAEADTTPGADTSDGPGFSEGFGATLAALKAEAAAEAERVTLAAAVETPPAADPFADSTDAADPTADLAAAPTGPGDLFADAASLPEPTPVPSAPAGAAAEPLFPAVAAAPPAGFGAAPGADPFTPSSDPFVTEPAAETVAVLPAPPATEAASVSANGAGPDPFDLLATDAEEPPRAPVEASVVAGTFDFGPADLPPVERERPEPPPLPAPASVKIAAAPPVPPPAADAKPEPVAGAPRPSRPRSDRGGWPPCPGGA